MYCDKENINILTSLLIAHGIRSAVVCPGSRNAAIVHNLREGGIECHPVTDERSAGFYALGLSLATKSPVVVCVTSGSAVLNVAPAVAEAYYRHAPLIVVTADRPPQDIGQLQGQTMPQPGAYGPLAVKSVSLPEIYNKATRKLCHRLANEALCCATGSHAAPVQINVPISEPLFQFTMPELPKAQVIKILRPQGSDSIVSLITKEIAKAQKPLIVVGQCQYSSRLQVALKRLSTRMPVLCEPLSASILGSSIDSVLEYAIDNAEMQPDLIIQMGDDIVSKNLKRYLSSVPGASTIEISSDGEIHDTFSNLAMMADIDGVVFAETVARIADADPRMRKAQFTHLWNQAIRNAAEASKNDTPEYGEKYAVREFERIIATQPKAAVHYANSTSVRLACQYARHYVYANRGVNGIEGSLSTAAGFSLAYADTTYCVIGDLSFFYDSNALWNKEINGHMRILLLNNGYGKIFSTLPRLSRSEAYPELVAGAHATTAEGLCQSYGVLYRAAEDSTSLSESLAWLTSPEPDERPRLLEVKISNK